MSEAELYAPDLDEGELDVERYELPDESEIADPYLKRVWGQVRKLFAGGEYVGDGPYPIPARPNPGPTLPSVPQVKAVLSYLTKGQGEPCKQGETSENTGCEPKSGQAKPGHQADQPTGSPKDQAKQIKNKLMAGQSLTADELKAAPSVLKTINTHGLAALAKKVLGKVPEVVGGVAKHVYVSALISHAKQKAPVQAEKEPTPKAEEPKPAAKPAPKQETTGDDKLDEAIANWDKVAGSVGQDDENLDDPIDEDDEDKYAEAEIDDETAAEVEAENAASNAGGPLSPVKTWEDYADELDKVNYDSDTQEELVKKALAELNYSLDDTAVDTIDAYIDIKKKINSSINGAFLTANEVGEAIAALKKKQQKPTQETKLQPPEPKFTGKDANGHCWVNGQQVSCDVYDAHQAEQTGGAAPAANPAQVKKKLAKGKPLTAAELAAVPGLLKGMNTHSVAALLKKVMGTLPYAEKGKQKQAYVAALLHFAQGGDKTPAQPASGSSVLPKPPAQPPKPQPPKPQAPAPGANYLEKPAEPLKAPAFPAAPKDLTYVGEAGGSTGTKKMKDKDGNLFFVKEGSSPEHVKEEFAADQVYEALGFLTPPGKMYDQDGKPVKVTADTGGVNLKDVIDPPAIATTQKPPEAGFTGKDNNGHCWVDGKMVECSDYDKRAAALKELQKGFVADCLMGNWDVAGMNYDNVKVLPDGRVVRIDNGGSFRYRAMGKAKTSNQWKEAVTEVETMLDPNKAPQAAKVFKGITPKDIAAQVQHLAANKDKVLAAAPKEVRPMLEKRIAWLVENYGTVGQPKTTIKGSLYLGQGPDWPTTPPSPNHTYTPPQEDLKHFLYKPLGDQDERKGGTQGSLPADFLKDARKVFDAMPAPQKAAIKKYTSNFAFGLNDRMRDCPETLDCLSPEQKKVATEAMKGLASAGIHKPPVRVWRKISLYGKDLKTFMESLQLAMETGDEIRMPGFKSCSTNTSGWSGGVCFEITAYSGMYVDSESVYNGNESEFLQSHNVRYRVTGIKTVPWQGGGTKQVIQLEEVHGT